VSGIPLLRRHFQKNKKNTALYYRFSIAVVFRTFYPLHQNNDLNFVENMCTLDVMVIYVQAATRWILKLVKGKSQPLNNRTRAVHKQLFILLSRFILA
jgi:hypothetical protein